MKQIIKIEDVVTRFGRNVVHDRVSFSIKKGEIYGLLGGSGSGKSTLLREMIMLQKYNSGKVFILDKELKKISSKEKEALRKKWGVLFQFGALFSSLNVLENVGITLKEYTKLPKSLIEEIAHTKLKMVGLPPKAATLFPSELSGGMKKRVGLARALAMDPELLFLDEPTSGLDPASAEAFDRLIVELRNMLGLTVVMVTHDLDTIKNALDRFIIIHNKKILIEGNYEEAINYEHYAIRDFFKTKG